MYCDGLCWCRWFGSGIEEICGAGVGAIDFGLVHVAIVGDKALSWSKDPASWHKDFKCFSHQVGDSEVGGLWDCENIEYDDSVREISCGDSILHGTGNVWKLAIRFQGRYLVVGDSFIWSRDFHQFRCAIGIHPSMETT